VAIGIVATPASVAQDVADRLVAAGVTSILNFAPSVISVPKGVSLRKVDLSIELQILSFYQQRRLGLPSLPDSSEADPSEPAGVGLPS
jgi:redox-sensing transcriptional repressor